MTKHYVIREQQTTDNPADKGPEIKRFLTWGEAQAHNEKLNLSGRTCYISIEYLD